jgi:hypothetical protein
VDDQFFFGEELERAIALHIDGIAKIAVRGWKDGDDDAAFMIVRRFVDPFANRKFGHRELLSGIVGAIIPTNWLTDLKQVRRGSGAYFDGSLGLKKLRPYTLMDAHEFYLDDGHDDVSTRIPPMLADPALERLR